MAECTSTTNEEQDLVEVTHEFSKCAEKETAIQSLAT